MNRELKLATATTKLAKHWENTLIDWPGLQEKLSDPIIGSDTVEQYKRLPKNKRDEIKDVGGFVGGHLTGGLRRKGHIYARSLIALDLDSPPVGLLERLPELLPYEWVCYSTHSHTAEQPRLRLIIPVLRDMSPEEYQAVSRRIAADIGMDFFDDTTYEPHRLMYWPSKPIDGEFVYQENHGAWLDPDKVLARYDNWQDMTTWPTSSRQTEAIKARHEAQADPLEKPGLVGAFCRAYTIDEAIETYLKDIYLPGKDGRYTYAKGESANGVVIYDDKFSYSHHGTDPAGSQLTNAFDLVRIHLYGAEDADAKPHTPTNKLPSYAAMTRLAQADERVKKQLAQERMDEAREEFGEDTTEAGESVSTDWMTGLEITKSGKYADTLENLTLILTHDPKLQGIRYNELADSVDVTDPKTLPWEQVRDGWTDTDIAQLKLYIERKYHLYSPTRTSEALTIAAAARAYHPIKDYLGGLPTWDGVKRIDTLLIDYLGAPDTDYVRAVTRKTLIAAVKRVYQPGCKFDTVLILNGPQGTGKSTLFAKLGGQWFSDALSLNDMKDKTGAEKLQGYWILELGELAGMKKVETETVKSFISRTDDKYRAAYARTVETHPRQCIIVGSTNAENGFLRDVTGNRRFWPVIVKGESTKKTWDLSPELIAQLWAEALAGYKAHEPLHLTGELAEIARGEQDSALEADDRLGMVEDYLNTSLPSDWDQKTLVARRAYLSDDVANDFGGGVLSNRNVKDTYQRETVSNIEIWAECFRKDPGDMKPSDSYAMAAIMLKLDDWEKVSGSGGRKRLPLYGRQRIYQRKPDLEPPF